MNLRFSAALLGLLIFTAACAAERQELLEGVREIAAPGWPGCVSVCGERAFVVVAGRNGKTEAAVAGAAELGQGRIVALGHDGYLGADALRTADTRRFIQNCVCWLGRSVQPEVALSALPDLRAALQAAGMRVRDLPARNWSAGLSGGGVLVLTGTGRLSAQEVSAVLQHVRGGGGVLCADTPWGWLQMNPGKRLSTDHPGNLLLSAAGLLWADGGLGTTGSEGFLTAPAPAELTHAGRALAALQAQARGERVLTPAELAQATAVLTQAARAVPPTETDLLPKLRQLAADSAAAAVPTPDKPLKLDQPLPRLTLALQQAEEEQRPAAEVRAHPAAAAFPGGVPDEAPRLEQTLTVDTAVPDWHSTGLYAAPGEVIGIEVAAAAAGKGLGVQIGCHTDRLWDLESWRRVPQIVRSRALQQTQTEVASPFGGLLYITVPDDCKLGEVAVTIRGAVGAPRFVLGRSSPQEWRETLRSLPGPWAELESSSVVLTVPSDTVRALDNPVPLLEFWSHVLDCCAELSGRPLRRERPERYVADVQISAGYMHSGYPIMTHLDGATMATDLERLVTKGSWGHFHEMGHNHQSGDWTFAGTGEVTENLFSLYLIDRCCGLKDPGHPAIKPDERERKTREYLQAGAPFEKWQADPFLALYMYMQLQEAFGWEPYKKVFAEYRALPDGERPKTDDQKRDQWLVRFSKTVGRNLGPFFTAWGVPTSEAARDNLKGLPVWMPEGFPPK